MEYRPTCNQCSGTGKRTVHDFGGSHESPCIDCDGSGKGPAPNACKDCGGNGQWWTQRHPDDSPDIEYCERCGGNGKEPEFQGLGVI